MTVTAVSPRRQTLHLAEPAEPWYQQLVARIPALQVDNLLTARKAVKTTGRRFAVALHRQQALVSLIRQAYETEDWHGSVFPKEWLREVLRTGNSAVQQRLLESFFDYPKGHTGYSVGRREAKVYRLHPHVTCACDAVLRVNGQAIERMCDSLQHVPALLPEITDETIRQAIQATYERLDWETTPREDEETLRVLESTRLDVRQHHGLPNEFHQDRITAGGRPIPSSRNHLAGMKRQPRALLCAPQGWWDVDMRSCHLQIILDCGRAYHFSTTLLEAYLEDKEARHQQWAAAIQHEEPADFKELVLALVTGAPLTPWAESKVARMLGDKVKLWVSRPDVKALAKELRTAARAVVDHASHVPVLGGVVLHNAVGAACAARVAWKTEQTTQHEKPWLYSGAITSFILTGFEQWLIHRFLERVGAQVVCPIYDGWVSRSEPEASQLRAWEAEVRSLSVEQLQVELRPQLKASSFLSA